MLPSSRWRVGRASEVGSAYYTTCSHFVHCALLRMGVGHQSPRACGRVCLQAQQRSRRRVQWRGSLAASTERSPVGSCTASSIRLPQILSPTMLLRLRCLSFSWCLFTSHVLNRQSLTRTCPAHSLSLLHTFLHRYRRNRETFKFLSASALVKQWRA